MDCWVTTFIYHMYNSLLTHFAWQYRCIFFEVLLVLLLSRLFNWIPKEHAASNFLKCFSFQTKFQELFRTNVTSSAISAIDGIRYCNLNVLYVYVIPNFNSDRPIICIWIIIIHGVYYMFFSFDNVPEVLQLLDKLPVQPIFMAFVYVDYFFVLR